MKILSGTELAGFVKERQAKQVRALRQAEKIIPKLVIIKTTDNPVIETYVKMKRRYGEDILIDVDVRSPLEDELFLEINKANDDESVHGIIIQLPLLNQEQTQEAVDLVDPKKDVDGLGSGATLTPATPMAIDWLLAGYNVDLSNKKIVIIGNGRLVGAPLSKIWRAAGHDVTVCDAKTQDVPKEVLSGAIIVSAAGVPGLVHEAMLQHGAVVVDAATSAENGVIVGDVADDVYERDDVTVTPRKGGVGPLTVCALFDNVIRAARIASTES